MSVDEPTDNAAGPIERIVTIPQTSLQGLSRAAGSATGPAQWSPNPTLARVLAYGSRASMVLVALGLALALTQGQRGGHGIAAGTLLRDLWHTDGKGVLGVGLIVLIATPVAREVAALVLFRRQGEHPMVGLAALVLVLIGISLMLGAR